MPEQLIMDGNEAAGRVAHRLSEVVAIYPITPASPMGELADTLSARGTTNLWGDVPQVVEMQSEGGAAGTMHGALQGGALATTFTASQGLLLMLPNMYKVAGELSAGVIHVAARAIATHALSIFGDHGDVMAARGTGWSILHSSGVQEAQDMAAVAHAVTLRTRVPILHAMDGFRTSHELAGVIPLDADTLGSLVPTSLIDEHRARALRAADPVVRGTAQNPDVFFQSREAANPWHDAVPAVVSEVLAQFRELTGREYRIVEYHGHPEPTEAVVISGSGVWAARDAADRLNAQGRRCGVLHLRLFRPFPELALAEALPPTVQRLAVLDRCKEPGSAGEPLCVDVTSSLAGAAQQGRLAAMPHFTGGRYGLGSKEFTPTMAASVFDALAGDDPPQRFTIG
ncbi:MAG: pyruvate:ferredoxin (flavodoxin) oxidoreductase, partial [Microthrixaceae bacterium]